jgi:hypothetical protein
MELSYYLIPRCALHALTRWNQKVLMRRFRECRRVPPFAGDALLTFNDRHFKLTGG